MMGGKDTANIYPIMTGCQKKLVTSCSRPDRTIAPQMPLLPELACIAGTPPLVRGRPCRSIIGPSQGRRVLPATAVMADQTPPPARLRGICTRNQMCSFQGSSKALAVSRRQMNFTIYAAFWRLAVCSQKHVISASSLLAISYSLSSIAFSMSITVLRSGFMESDCPFPRTRYPTQNSSSSCRKRIDAMLNSLDEKDLQVVEAIIHALKNARETEVK